MTRLINGTPAHEIKAPEVPRRTPGDEPPLCRVPDPVTKLLDSLRRRLDDTGAAVLKLKRRPSDPERTAVEASRPHILRVSGRSPPASATALDSDWESHLVSSAHTPTVASSAGV